MTDFREMITREAKTLCALHARVHETFRNRSKDRQTWSDACAEFHSYRPAFESYLEQIDRKPEIHSKGTVEFMITFLEVDPWFFRSGYLKETMIRRLKRAPLTDVDKARLRTVCLDAVLRRPHREFKHYCRLARAVQTPDFAGNLERILEMSEDGSQRYRAGKMLQVMAS